MGSPVEIPYGPVILVRGPHRGRVGLYDDEEDDRGRPRLIVYLYDGVPRANAMAVVAEGESTLLPRSHVRAPSEREAIAILGLMQSTYTVGPLFTVAKNHDDGLQAVGADALMQRVQDLLAGSDEERPQSAATPPAARPASAPPRRGDAGAWRGAPSGYSGGLAHSPHQGRRSLLLRSQGASQGPAAWRDVWHGHTTYPRTRGLFRPWSTLSVDELLVRAYARDISGRCYDARRVSGE